MTKRNKILLPLLFSPFILAILAETFKLLATVFVKIKISMAFAAGFFLYFPFHRRMSNDTYIYVLAHEMSHALAAVLNGVKVKKISVKKKTGYVSMNKTNTFITLAPYFIPLYVLLIAAIYLISAYFADLTKYKFIFVALTGFFMSFHIANTLEIIFTGPLQSDIKQAGGRIFSISLIILLNCIVLILTLKILFPNLVFLKGYLAGTWQSSVNIILFLKRSVIYLYNTAKIYLG